jgi:cytoskeletal protein CcmA (bactofilin family)
MVFKKKEAAKASSQTVIRKAPPSIISADLHIVGDIEGDGELHIDGRVDGNIRCESLTVGEQGQVEGKIVVTTLKLLGTITGSVRAQAVSMMKTARMIGDVAHQKIEIDAGAMVDGLYKHLKPEDFEKRGERFKDVTPPDLPKAAIPRSPKSEDAMAKPAGKKEEPAKALH